MVRFLTFQTPIIYIDIKYYTNILYYHIQNYFYLFYFNQGVRLNPFYLKKVRLQADFVRCRSYQQ